MIELYLRVLTTNARYAIGVGVPVLAAMRFWLRRGTSASESRPLFPAFVAGSAAVVALVRGSSAFINIDESWVAASPVTATIVCVVLALIACLIACRAIYIYLCRAATIGELWIPGLITGVTVFCIAHSWQSYLLPVFLKYGLGYGVSMVSVPVFGLLVIGVVNGLIERHRSGLRASGWLMLAFAYFVCAEAIILAWPVLTERTALYCAVALLLIGPGILTMVVASALSNRMPLWSCILFLYSSLALLLSGKFGGAAPLSQLATLLVSGPVVYGLCALLCVLALCHVQWMMRRGPERAGPFWIGAMVWITLAPAFYFARLGMWPLMIFGLANVLIGIFLFAQSALYLRHDAADSGPVITAPQLARPFPWTTRQSLPPGMRWRAPGADYTASAAARLRAQLPVRIPGASRFRRFSRRA